MPRFLERESGCPIDRCPVPRRSLRHHHWRSPANRSGVAAELVPHGTAPRRRGSPAHRADEYDHRRATSERRTAPMPTSSPIRPAPPWWPWRGSSESGPRQPWHRCQARGPAPPRHLRPLLSETSTARRRVPPRADSRAAPLLHHGAPARAGQAPPASSPPAEPRIGVPRRPARRAERRNDSPAGRVLQRKCHAP